MPQPGLALIVSLLLIATAPAPLPDPFGLTLDSGPQGVHVSRVAADGLAFKAGIRTGDRILAVDGVEVRGETPDQIRGRLQAMRPDPARVRVARASGGQQEVLLRRSAPPPPSPVAGPAPAAQSEVSALAAVSVGQPLPDFKLERLGGGEVTLSSLRGKPIFLDFWATWCAPCRAEAPMLADLYRRFGDRIQMIGLSLDDNPGATIAYAAQQGLAYPHLRTAGWLDPTVMAFGVHRTGIPFNVLADSAGTIVALDQHGESLARAFDRLLAAR